MVFTEKRYFVGGYKDVVGSHGEVERKPIFRMRKKYIDFLKLKKKSDLEEQIKTLRRKLDFQMKEYNEIDDMDFSELKYLLQCYNKM